MKKISLFDKYVFRQVLIATLVGVLLFIVVWIAPETLLKVIRRTLKGVYTYQIALQLLTYEIPQILGKALPVGLLLGSLFSFDKLSKDFELTIFRGIGISFKRILCPVLVLSIILGGLNFLVHEKMIPYSTAKLKQLNAHRSNTPFVYTDKDINGKPKQAVIVSNFTGKEINNLVVLNFSQKVYSDTPIFESILVADNATTLDDKWVLGSGKKYSITTEGVFKNIENFDSVEVLKTPKAKSAYKLMWFSTKKARELTNAQLKKYISLLKQENLLDEMRYMLNKLYQRYFQPFICILFTILGCTLGFSRPREQRLIGFTIAIATIFLYYVTLPFFDLLAEKNIINPLIAASTPLIVILGSTIALIKSKDLL